MPLLISRRANIQAWLKLDEPTGSPKELDTFVYALVLQEEHLSPTASRMEANA